MSEVLNLQEYNLKGMPLFWQIHDFILNATKIVISVRHCYPVVLPSVLAYFRKSSLEDIHVIFSCANKEPVKAAYQT